MEADEMVGRLRDALAAAVRARDAIASTALRSTLAAIANAEAVAPGMAGAGAEAAPTVAGTVPGVGASDVPRRRLLSSDILRLVTTEIDERMAAARQYESLGQEARAQALRGEAAVLKRLERTLKLG